MEFVKKNVRTPLVFSLTINLLFLFLCILFGDLQYGALDDYFMAGVLTGIHGTSYNPHLYFVNALYGYALLPLYHLLPKVGWYYLGEMFSVFLCFSTICFILIKKIGQQWGSLASILFLSFFATDYYLVVQFTQCGSLLSATGMLVFACCIISDQDKPHDRNLQDKTILFRSIPLLYSLFLLFWGSIMRWQSFLMGMPFFACALLFNLRTCWNKRYSTILFFLILFIGAFTMHAFDQSLYNNELYRPYKEIQGPRSAIMDAANFDMNESYDDLEETGISGQDFHMARSWTFYDTEVFSVENMHKMINVFNHHRNIFSWQEYPKLIMDALQRTSKTPIFWAWILFSVLIFVTNRNKFSYVTASLAVIIGLSAHLISVNRLVYRVEGGFWLYATVLAIPLIKEIKYKVSYKPFICLIVLLITSNVVLFYKDGNLVRDITSGIKEPIVAEDSTDYKKIFAYIDSNPDKIFLLDMPTYMHFAQHKNPPYMSEPTGSWRRTVSFGFWTPYLPEIAKTLKEFGIKNPMKEVVNDNVIVIGQDNLEDYLERHYFKDVSMDTLKQIGTVTFLKYRRIE